jgi:hypothetical protein
MIYELGVPTGADLERIAADVVTPGIGLEATIGRA